MDPVIKEKWVKALRSGEYEQGRGCFYNASNNSYCCVGVLAVVQNPGKSIPAFFFRETASGVDSPWLLFNKAQGTVLYKMNDCEGKSFVEIADYIEKYL